MAVRSKPRARWNDRAEYLGKGWWRCACGREYNDPLLDPPSLRCPPCGKALLEDAKEGRGPDYHPPTYIT